VRESRAGRGNSGERFWPRGGDLRRVKALAGFSRDMGDTGNYSSELAQMGRRETEREGGKGSRRETGVRGGNPAAFVLVPHPGRVRLQ
jgi:hypothetical protein